jgi:hypothetical protein
MSIVRIVLAIEMVLSGKTGMEAVLSTAGSAVPVTAIFGT